MRLKLTVVTVIGFLAIAAALAYQDPDLSRKQLEALELLKQMQRDLSLGKAISQPNTSSANWKPLSDDVGLMLFTDEYGTQRGTLYVRLKGYWKPVALQGALDLGPEVLPLGGR